MTCLKIILLTWVLVTTQSVAQIGSTLEHLSFEEKRDHFFEKLTHQPLKITPKQPPLKKNGPPYTRNYSWSIINFASKVFLLKEKQFYHSANHALRENCSYYLNSQAARDHRDSFYWSAEELSRIVRFYGSHGTKTPSLLEPQTEDSIYKLMWAWSRNNSKSKESEIEISQSWKIHGSENHHIQKFSTCWNFAYLLQSHPDYKQRNYDDGATAQQHYEQWNLYAKTWICERAKKGLFVEIACGGYNTQTLKCLHSFYDFGDQKLKHLAGQLLDLYWASWAQEQIDGIRGGFKTRTYQSRKSRSGYEFITRWAAFYFRDVQLDHHIRQADYTVLTSDYRLPKVVKDIYEQRPQQPSYEIIERRQGLVHEGYYSGSAPYAWLKNDGGGILRYSYCTPEFILGSAIFEARDSADWAKISTQNRWHGLVLKGHQDARVYLQCKNTRDPRENIITFNQSWMLQKMGCLITQKLPLDSISNSLLKKNVDAEKLCIWWSQAGRQGELQKKEKWVFGNYSHTYVATHCVESSYTLHHEEGNRNKYSSDHGGIWQMVDQEFAPVVLEVSPASKYSNFEQFMSACLQQKVILKNRELQYQSLDQIHFSFDLDQKEVGKIHQQRIDLNPKRVFDSPFIQSIYNSGRILLQGPNHKKTLDFSL
jgi:hypothetical protein